MRVFRPASVWRDLASALRNSGCALRDDRRGSSAMELVILGGVLMALMLGFTDMAMATRSALKLEQAAARAAEWATAPGTVALNYSAMGSEAQSAYGEPLSALPKVTTWLECDGVKAASFTSVCPAGQQIARYAQVAIEDEYMPMFDFGGLLQGNGANGGFKLNGDATVRIQ
jgi:hypothetical protein